ncbi:hypothetical protein ACOSQ3_020766 [Xanthoceras sorbifolium]
MDNGYSRFFTLPYLALPPVIPAGPSLHRQPPPHLASSSSSLPRQLPHLAISVVADFIARVVFDAAPTLEEAKDATADLKEALDRVYLSSPESAAYQNGGTFKDGPKIMVGIIYGFDNVKWGVLDRYFNGVVMGVENFTHDDDAMKVAYLFLI